MEAMPLGVDVLRWLHWVTCPHTCLAGYLPASAVRVTTAGIPVARELLALSSCVSEGGSGGSGWELGHGELSRPACAPSPLLV